MAVAAKDFFEHIDSFMDYRKTVYEVSDQTIKSGSSRISVKKIECAFFTRHFLPIPISNNGKNPLEDFP